MGQRRSGTSWGRMVGIGMAGAALLALAMPAWAGQRLAITKAKWRAERSILRIEGTAAKPNSIVMLRNAETKSLIGSAAVRADGKWMLKLRNPKDVPARTVAECDDYIVECAVADAPVN